MKLLSTDDVARVLGVSIRTAYRIVHSLTHYRVGNLLRVDEADLYAYLNQNKERPWRVANESTDSASTSEAPPDHTGETGSTSKEGDTNEVSAPKTSRSRSPTSARSLPDWVKPIRARRN